MFSSQSCNEPLCIWPSAQSRSSRLSGVVRACSSLFELVRACSGLFGLRDRKGPSARLSAPQAESIWGQRNLSTKRLWAPVWTSFQLQSYCEIVVCVSPSQNVAEAKKSWLGFGSISGSFIAAKNLVLQRDFEIFTREKSHLTTGRKFKFPTLSKDCLEKPLLLRWDPGQSRFYANLRLDEILLGKATFA
jgi:hypothetical protein